MTLEQLHWWRRMVPFGIATGCILPFVISQNSLDDAERINQVIVPAIAAIIAFLYIGLQVREVIWKPEREKLGPRIRAALFVLLPNDLDVTPDEWMVLHGETYKRLNGVFWEAVDRDPHLRAQKQHFYSNGIVYTTAIDAFLICGLSAVCYIVAYFFVSPRQIALLVWAGVLVVLAFLSWALILPGARKKHFALSDEQLDLVRRHQKEFIENRFRDIVLTHRRERLL
jgi:hypothetical protein